jgi:hypothetical protein
LAVLVLSVVAVLTLASGGALAAVKCKKVNGTLTLRPVSGPACMSAVDVCATGTYRGDLKGQAAFTGSSLTQAVDTPTTGLALLTGDNLIHTAVGPAPAAQYRDDAASHRARRSA